MRRILDDVRDGRVVKLPAFDRTRERGSDRYALLSIGLEPNEYNGTLGPFRYQFEGEEDLLHLIVTRLDTEALTPQEGQRVAGFVLRGVPQALIWLRPGEYSQHFYFGHDELMGNLQF